MKRGSDTHFTSNKIFYKLTSSALPFSYSEISSKKATSRAIRRGRMKRKPPARIQVELIVNFFFLFSLSFFQSLYNARLDALNSNFILWRLRQDFSPFFLSRLFKFLTEFPHFLLRKLNFASRFYGEVNGDDLNEKKH